MNTREQIQKQIDSMRDGTPEAGAAADAWQEELDSGGAEELVHVEAVSARPTSTGVDGGVDVDFTLTLDGDEHEGQVTLLPHEDGRPGYGRWGDRDHWLDGRTVALTRGRSDGRGNEILDAIEAACAPVARSAA